MQPTKRRIGRRAVLAAAWMASLVLLFTFRQPAANLVRSAWRWAFDPLYEGDIRLACSSIEGTLTLLGPADPAKRIYINEQRDTRTEPAAGFETAYHCSIAAVPIVVLKSGQALCPAFAIDRAKFTGLFGGVRKYREIDGVSGTIGLQGLRLPNRFASHSEIAAYAYLLVDLDDENSEWRVFEFTVASDSPDVVIPELRTLPTVDECPRGDAYWHAYNAAVDEQGIEHWSAPSSRERDLSDRYNAERAQRLRGP